MQSNKGMVFFVNLENGFSGEPVENWQDGVRVYTKEPVFNPTGLADSVELRTRDQNRVSLELRLPATGARQSIELDLGNGIFIRVSRARTAEPPFEFHQQTEKPWYD
ncbi:MAG: hypothetical protein Q7R47_02700 [Candidatus Diapherotrites archaeon]|nr:hypothetical protein [Candidatus Diapherotrites archaeon]